MHRGSHQPINETENLLHSETLNTAAGLPTSLSWCAWDFPLVGTENPMSWKGHQCREGHQCQEVRDHWSPWLATTAKTEARGQGVLSGYPRGR